MTNLIAEIVLSDAVTVFDTQSNGFSHNTRLPEAFNDHLFLLVEDMIFALGGRTGSFGSEESTSRMFIGDFGE